MRERERAAAATGTLLARLVLLSRWVGASFIHTAVPDSAIIYGALFLDSVAVIVINVMRIRLPGHSASLSKGRHLHVLVHIKK